MTGEVKDFLHIRSGGQLFVNGPTVTTASVNIRADTGGDCIVLEENSGGEYWRVLIGGGGDLVFQNGTSEFLRMKDENFIDIKETDDKTPTVSLSGALFISGGALWYKGFSGTYKQVAPA